MYLFGAKTADSVRDAAGPEVRQRGRDTPHIAPRAHGYISIPGRFTTGSRSGHQAATEAMRDRLSAVAHTEFDKHALGMGFHGVFGQK